MLHKVLPILVLITVTLFADSIPTATGPQPGSQLIGEPFSSQVCFSNTGDKEGYEPEFEIVTPSGVKLTAATFYSSDALAHQESCNANECNVTNPIIGQQSLFSPIDGNESYYVLDFPIGSFSTQWPEQCMDLTFELESSGDHIHPGVPLDIKTVAVFALGETAVDDGNYTYGPEHTMTVIPNVYTLEKSNNATEGERATGSKYPIIATIVVDIAKDENISNLDINDTLDGAMQFLSFTPIAGCTAELPNNGDTSIPGGTLHLNCPGPIQGKLGANDYNLTYTYYIPEKDSNDTVIVNPSCERELINLVSAKAQHDFNNTWVDLSMLDANSTVTAKAMTMHKTAKLLEDHGTAGFGPGDVIEYSLTMDVSGYSTSDNVIVTDILGDGQSYTEATGAKYKINNSAYTDFNTSNIQFDNNRTIGFNLSSELNNATMDANSTIVITFITTINETYENGNQIGMGDRVGNHVDLAYINGSTNDCNDDSYAYKEVDTEKLTKTVYAVNGNTNVSDPIKIKPGDTVTYRLQSKMPIESFYDFKIADYLPVPIFNVSNEFTTGDDFVGQGSTVAGTWAAGPDNNYTADNNISFVVDSAQNSLTWKFGDENNSYKAPVLDVLFTVTATNEPMADNLTLANIAGTEYKNSEGTPFGTADLIKIITEEPSIEINKTIVATSNPQGQSFPTNSLDKVDANDTITYKINLENSGHSTAYDVNVMDRLNSGAAMTCDSATITTDTNGSVSSTTGDLFNGTFTIEHIDALSYYNIEYKCTVHQDGNPGPDIDNNATLKDFASTPGGPTFVHKDIVSVAKLIMDEDTKLTKSITGTSLAGTPDDKNSNPGEIVYFEINATLGEGTYVNFNIADSLCDTPLVQENNSANVHYSGLNNNLFVEGTPSNTHGWITFSCSYQNKVADIGTKTNTAIMSATNIDDVRASVNWKVTKPDANPSKVMAPNKVDSGDEVTVTMNWDSNNTANPSYRCTVTDQLDPIFVYSSIVMTQTPSGYTCLPDTTTGLVTCTSIDENATCGPGLAKFKVTLDDNLTLGGEIVNTIVFQGHSLPKDHSKSDIPEYDKIIDDNASAPLELHSPFEPEKIFVKTSEDFTDPGDNRLSKTPVVAIGEVVDVNITFGFYEGVTKDVSLIDRFLKTAGARGLVYVPGTMKISRSDGNISVGNAAINSLLSTTPTAVPDGLFTANSTQISMEVGDVTNSTHGIDINAKTLTLSFRVKIQNKVNVQAGSLVKNRGRVQYKTDDGSQKGINGKIRQVRVLEASPSINKDANQTSVRAGTSLKYTIELCNDKSNTTNYVTSAFNWKIADRIPDDINLSSGPTYNTNGTGATIDTSASSGRDINATINQLDPGECIFIYYDAVVNQSAQFGQVMTNTAKFKATSLPGPYGTAGSLPGLTTQESGELNGERTGAGGINDLYGQDTQSVVMDKGSVSKKLLSRESYYAIGEEAQYQIELDIFKGSSDTIIVNDILPDGLDVNISNITFREVGTITYDSFSPTIALNGKVVSITYKNLVVSSEHAQIFIDYNATVENSIPVQDGTTLKNDLNVTLISSEIPGGQLTVYPLDPVKSITVGEPDLEMQKKITAGATGSDENSTVSWEVHLINTGHTTAYDVNWTDTLPAGLSSINNASFTATGNTIFKSGTTVPLDQNDFVIVADTLSLHAFDLPVGSSITISFDSVVDPGVIAGQKMINTTQSSYKSILSANGSMLGGRNSIDCGDDDVDTTLNNYCEYAKEEFYIDDILHLSKNLLGADRKFTIGETLRYLLRVEVINGVTQNVVLTDQLPVGLSYVSHTCQDAGNTAMIFSCDLLSSDPVQIDLGDIHNPSDGNKTNNYVEIEIEARVDNVLSNQNGLILENGDTNGTKVFVTSTAKRAEVKIPVDIEIVEPDLTVIKMVNPLTQSLGDIVTYSIELSHSSLSTSDAYDVNFTDVLDSGLHYIPGSATGATVTQSGQTLTFDFSHLSHGSSKYVTYKARIDSNASVGVDLNNSLETVFASLANANGTASGARNGDDGEGPYDDTVLNNYYLHTSAAVLTNDAALNPTKSVRLGQDSNNDGLINAGDFLTYNLHVENKLPFSVSDINITDTLDENLTMLLNSIRVFHNNTQVLDTNDSNEIDWTIDGYWYKYANGDVTLKYNSDTNEFELFWVGTLAQDDIFDVTYDAKINDGMVTNVAFGGGGDFNISRTHNDRVTAGVIIANKFTVDSNSTVPTPSNEVNITTDQRGIAAKPVKTLTSTDQDFTDPNNTNIMNTPPVAVGEIIDVMLDFNFTGGTTKTVVLKDNFDRNHFVRVNEANLTRSCDDMWVGDFNSTFGADTTISVEDNITNTPNGFELKIGDIFNPHYQDMNMTCSLQLTFRLRVDNNASVQQGVQLDDNGSVSFSEFHSDTNTSSMNELHSDPVGVMTNEPDVEVTKTVNPMTAKAGDTLKYTIKVCNDESNTAAHATRGFNWTVVDRLPDELDLVGTPMYGGQPMFNGRDMNVNITRIDPGHCEILDYNVTVNGAAQFEQDINNTVRVESTSLPGIVVGERTGTNTPAVNDLNNSSIAILKIEEPGVSKAVIAQKSYYPIGDIVEYNITLAFTGSARGLKIIDHFPRGMKYVPGSVRLILPPNTTVEHNPPVGVAGARNDISFNIGDLNITTAGNLYMELKARVEDSRINVDGSQLVNWLDMTFTEPNTGEPVDINTTAPAITVGEPNLDIDKSITTDLSTPKGAGDMISYKIEIKNSGTTTAYNVKWSDHVPAHTGEIQNPHQQVMAGTAYQTGTQTALDDQNFTIDTINEPDDRIKIAPFDLSPGAILMITFDTIIQANVIPSETLENDTGAVTQSLVNGGRTTASRINIESYAASDKVSFSINQLPEAIDNCTPPLHVTHYGENPGELWSNDKLGDGIRAEHTWRLITAPTNGSVVVNKNGTYVYTPNADYDGPDGFRYEIEDSNGDKSQANVCIDVDCASSQTSDGGDAFGTMSMLLMILLTGLSGLYFIRREERGEV